MDETALPDGKWKQTFRRQIKNWYSKHARELPWRKTRDPYHVWVSEIMLQQTQVATVIPYFERFIGHFPTVRHLASAAESDVLRLWEGLGYYRRARQLHKAAQEVVAKYQGEFPVDEREVAALPGIGRYTCGAILSIAMDRRMPILEANTIRLNSRLVGFEGNPTSKSGQNLLWRFAEEILPQKNVGHFNQALMELGSLVCTPKSPNCTSCPVASGCRARAKGRQESIPQSKKRQVYQDLAETAVVVAKGGKVLVRRCAEGERWAGLWDFPRFETKGSYPDAEVARLTGINIGSLEKLTTLKHGVTKYRITLTCLQAKYRSGRLRVGGACAWVSVRQLENYPLSVTGRKIAKLLA